MKLARIHGGRVIEYPALVGDTKLVGELVGVKEISGNFTPDSFNRVVSRLKMVKGQPCLVEELELKTLRELIEENYVEPLRPYFISAELNASTIPMDVMQEMVLAVRKIGTVELDRFAQSRGYDDIVSLISYKDDPFPQFAQEGSRGFELRSLYWSVFTKFNEGVATGVVEFPRTAEGIIAMFPTLTWE